MKPVIYWIDYAAQGRLAILARPQGGDALPGDIQDWKDSGLDVVVSMLTDADNLYLDLSAEGELCRSIGLQFIRFPLADFGVPDSMEAALDLVKELTALLASGKRIGLHCHGSIGRAPLMASCVLMYLGVSADAAYALISSARGYQIPEAETQAAWGRNFARQLSSSLNS